MTLDSFDQALANMPQDAALIFRTDAGDILGGYHITEFKHARVDSIDCGGRTDAWTEAVMQVLDGNGGAHMTVGKFRKVLGQSLARLPGLGNAELKVEFAPGNDGARLWHLDRPVLDEGAVIAALTEVRALCKPMQAAVAGLRGSAVPGPVAAGRISDGCCSGASRRRTQPASCTAT